MIDFCDLDTYTRKLCSHSVLDDRKILGLLCSYYEDLNDSERNKFHELSERFYWYYKQGRKKYKITKNAIYIADRIKRELEVSCYPYIDKIATKGWSTSGGTFSFGMTVLYGSVDREIYSFEPVKLYLRKNTELNIGPYNGFAEIVSVERKM